MNQPERYDAIIIGAGQGGKPLATAMAKKGWKTAIIERKYVGGTCINYGCTPTKTLIASAQAAFEARRADVYGVETGPVRVDFKAIKARKNQVVERFRQSIETAFGKTDNLTLLYGEARFTGPKQLTVNGSDGAADQLLTAETIVIDCGSSPMVPPIPGLDSVPYLTSKTLLDLDELPSHLVIIGGGYISVEFSQMYRRFGAEVTLIVRGKHLLDREDEDIAAELTKILEAEGINVLLNSEVQQIRSVGPNVEVLLDANDVAQVAGSHLLLGVGTTPNTAALNLDAAGIVVDDQGFIKVSDKLETSQPGVYALGEIAHSPAFTHISYDDFRVVQQNLLEGGSATTAGRMVPYVVFTDPQLGRIGLSENEAKQQERAVRVGKMPMTSVARAIETDHTQGLLKVLVDPQTEMILGAAVLGMEGGELMTMLQLAMMGNLPYTRLRDAIFAHPTLAESLNNLFSKLER